MPIQNIFNDKSVSIFFNSILVSSSRNISVNTDPVKLGPHLKMKSQSMMTDVHKELLPIYCNKCCTEINTNPTQKILEVMTDLSYNRPLIDISTLDSACKFDFNSKSFISFNK